MISMDMIQRVGRFSDTVAVDVVGSGPFLHGCLCYLDIVVTLFATQNETIQSFPFVIINKS